MAPHNFTLSFSDDIDDIIKTGLPLNGPGASGDALPRRDTDDIIKTGLPAEGPLRNTEGIINAEAVEPRPER